MCWPRMHSRELPPSTREPWSNARFSDGARRAPWDLGLTRRANEPARPGPDRHRDCYNARVFVIHSTTLTLRPERPDDRPAVISRSLPLTLILFAACVTLVRDIDASARRRTKNRETRNRSSSC
jgi:hypothetical protein